MAGAASLNALALRAGAPSLSRGPPAAGRRDGAALALSWTPRPRFPSLRAARRVITVRAAAAAAGNPEEEWGNEHDPAVASAQATTSEVAELKARLKDALYGTERALRAPSGTRAEVAGLVTQLEARHRTVAPAEALASLDGNWVLVFALNYMDRSWKRHAEAWYTSFSQLLPILGSERLPELVTVEEISQAVDSKNFTVQNCIKFSGPLATTSVSTNAKFEVRSPRRVQIKFDKGIISTPLLTDSIMLPQKFELLEKNIDLRLLEGIFSSIENAASSVAKTVFGQPHLKIPMWTNNDESWLLTTYLDEELTISRDDGSSIFVLFKKGSTLLN